MRLTNDACWAHLRGAGHGILATTGARGTIDAVPVCFAVSGKLIASPIDRVKPKDTNELGRLKNLDRDDRATLICDHWKRHDWSQLWWVRAHLVQRSNHHVSEKVRSGCEDALREKYEQYRGTEFDELIVFEVKSLVGWAATEERADEEEDGDGDGEESRPVAVAYAPPPGPPPAAPPLTVPAPYDPPRPPTWSEEAPPPPPFEY